MSTSSTSLPEPLTLNRLFRLQWEEAQQAFVLLYPEGMVKLNTSAGEILKRCDGTHTLQTLVEDIEKSFNTNGLTSEVKSLLEEAHRRNWLT